MNVRLPEDFILPTFHDIDQQIEQMDGAIINADGAHTFLYNARQQRKNSFGFYANVLAPIARRALFIEKHSASGQLLDTQHRFANAMVSGGVFGHIVNEIAYPSIDLHVPYDRMIPDKDAMDDETRRLYEQNGEYTTRDGLRIGHTAMARLYTSYLTDRSRMTVNSWVKDLVIMPEQYDAFRTGFGLALYSAWDTYTDQLIREGRSYLPLDSGQEAGSDQGNTTSI